MCDKNEQKCYIIGMSDKRIVRHAETGLFVREDGAVLMSCGGKAKRNGNRAYKWKFGSNKGTGYLAVTVNHKEWGVHRLVAECFIPNPDHKPSVDHIDRNKKNNRVENLRWATASEQQFNTSRSEEAWIRRINKAMNW